jgi:hypothetical protein
LRGVVGLSLLQQGLEIGSLLALPMGHGVVIVIGDIAREALKYLGSFILSETTKLK